MAGGASSDFFAIMKTLGQWLGIELDPVSSKEKWISLLGGLLAVLSLVALTQWAAPVGGAPLVIASMGASAVLLFAVPHGQLSQPWPVIAGHTLSALIGVFCARMIPLPALAAGCAVGLAIGVMHQLKCIHPPRGATALTAVIGGPAIHAMGYEFVWSPVLLNALVMVGVAVAFNALVAWRRYPAFLNRRPAPQGATPEISHEDVIKALRQLDSFVDITEDDLIRLCGLLAPGQTLSGVPVQKVSAPLPPPPTQVDRG